ncbi:hypothetical protein Tco_0508664 [Tanacetum coccineum]
MLASSHYRNISKQTTRQDLNIGKDKYENVAWNLVLKETFGVGFNGYFWAAKRMVEEVGSLFMLLQSSFVKLESENHENNLSSEVASGNSFQGMRLLPNNLIPQKASYVMSLVCA